MTRVVRRLVLVVVAALLLAGCGRSGSSTDPSEPLLTAGVQTGNLLAHGVVRSGGTPVEGATVTLQLAAVGSAPVFGETPERWSSPQVTTSADGTWAFSLDPTKIPEAYFPKLRSFLDFDLVFASGTRVVLSSGTVFRRTDPDGWRTEGAGPPDGVMQFDVDLETGAVVKTDSLGETEEPGSQ